MTPTHRSRDSQHGSRWNADRARLSAAMLAGVVERLMGVMDLFDAVIGRRARDCGIDFGASSVAC